jgi:hypothetical protein
MYVIVFKEFGKPHGIIVLLLKQTCSGETLDQVCVNFAFSWSTCSESLWKRIHLLEHC